MRSPKKKQTPLTAEERGYIIALREEEYTHAEIAKKLKRPESSIKTFWYRYQKKGSIKDGRRANQRPRKTTPAQDRVIVGSFENRSKPAWKVAEDVRGVDIHVSARTVSRRLCERGLHGCVARKKPQLRAYNVMKRLQWAKEHANWTVEQWERVLWSDESPFTIYRERGRVYVRHRVGEAYHPDCVLPTVKHGGAKIQVWGCFTAKGVGRFKQIEGIMDKHVYHSILVNHARKSMLELGDGSLSTLIFQHDNDPKHTSHKCRDYLKKWPNVMEWVAQSPDLNPIENLWAELERRLRARPMRATSKGDLFNVLKEEWEGLEPDFLKKLVSSMPRRCAAVIKAKGYWTKY